MRGWVLGLLLATLLQSNAMASVTFEVPVNGAATIEGDFSSFPSGIVPVQFGFGNVSVPQLPPNTTFLLFATITGNLPLENADVCLTLAIFPGPNSCSFLPGSNSLRSVAERAGIDFNTNVVQHRRPIWRSLLQSGFCSRAVRNPSGRVLDNGCSFLAVASTRSSRTIDLDHDDPGFPRNWLHCVSSSEGRRATNLISV